MEKYFPDYKKGANASQIEKMPANDGLLGKKGERGEKSWDAERNKCPLNGGDWILGVS